MEALEARPLWFGLALGTRSGQALVHLGPGGAVIVTAKDAVVEGAGENAPGIMRIDRDAGGAAVLEHHGGRGRIGGVVPFEAADGVVVQDDPLPALTQAVTNHRAFEVVVVTKPKMLDDTFRRDWASRAREALGVPVLHLYTGSSIVG